MIKIVQKDTPILREIAREVRKEEIGTPKLRKIIMKMQQALEEQDDGVAIAAPQIGENLRLFVMSRKVFDIIASEKKAEGPEQSEGETKEYSDMIFINPKITKLSKEKVDTEEGCLSVRYLYGKVKRAKKATVTALDENGEKILVGGSGLIAQIFQHEVDHLDGILFTDKAKDLEEIPPRA